MNGSSTLRMRGDWLMDHAAILVNATYALAILLTVMTLVLVGVAAAKDTPGVYARTPSLRLINLYAGSRPIENPDAWRKAYEKQLDEGATK